MREPGVSKLLCLSATGFGAALLLLAAEVTTPGRSAMGTRRVQFPDGSRLEATVHPAPVLLSGQTRVLLNLLAGGHQPRPGLVLFEGRRLWITFVGNGPSTSNGHETSP